MPLVTKKKDTTTMAITNGMGGICSMVLVVLMAEISVISVPRLAIKSAPNMNMATLTPNFSRIRSARPLRVMTVSRMPISWVTPSRMVIMTSGNRIG